MELDTGRPFFISPPFGTYLSHRRAYSVLGSFTLERRPGRTGQVLRTVRPVPGGWINKIGLRNPGMDSLPKFWFPNGPDGGTNGPFKEHQIVSLAPLAVTDFHAIERWLDERFNRAILEINISCPNVDEHPDLPPGSLLSRIIGGGATVIFKLPPLPIAVDVARLLTDAGARYLHLSNTLPSPIGGISGAAQREVNLPLVERVTRTLPGVEIIAGGGIYAPEHLRAYRDAGATRFSLATAWFWPPRAYRVMRVTA